MVYSNYIIIFWGTSSSIYGIKENSNQYANRQGKVMLIFNEVNSAGVIPVIFASTILSIPMTITGFFTQDVNSGWGSWINQILVTLIQLVHIICSINRSIFILLFVLTN